LRTKTQYRSFTFKDEWFWWNLYQEEIKICRLCLTHHQKKHVFLFF
jgi:hypothetical protein